MNPLGAQGKRLGSPGISAAPEGGQWLTDFMNACSDCQIDFIAFHWYGDGAQWFIDYANNLHNTYNKPLWCTEFASTNGDAQGMSSQSWLYGIVFTDVSSVYSPEGLLEGHRQLPRHHRLHREVLLVRLRCKFPPLISGDPTYSSPFFSPSLARRQRSRFQ